jgi:hypothetical protein
VAYSALRDKKNELIRKARDGSVFIAPMSATSLTAITTGAGSALVTLPAGWEDLGWVTSDGVGFGRETEQSDVTSFGSLEPTRSDVTSDIITMTVVAQETKLLTIGLYTGVDTTDLEATPVTSELVIPKPSQPAGLHYRVLALFVDEVDEGEVYIARYMPRARITEYGEQAFTSGDEPIAYSLTFTGFEDSTAGFSHQWHFAGPGWKAMLSDMGVPQGV